MTFAISNNNYLRNLTSDIKCRSGSRLLLLVLYENVVDKLQPGEKLVVIYSNTHMQTGLLTKDKRVIAFEMTKSGKGIQDIGHIDQISVPMRILDAGHDLAQTAINRKAHPKESILLDTVPENYIEKENKLHGKDAVIDTIRQFIKSGFKFEFGKSKIKTTDQYGFSDGSVEVPEDRQLITSSDYLPSDMIAGGGFNQSSNGVYDAFQSAEDSMGIDIANLMTKEEKIAVAEFEQYSNILSPYLNEVSSSYKRILYDENINVQKEVRNILNNGRKMIAYMEANDIDAKYVRYKKAISSCQSRNSQYDISYPRNPRDYYIDVLNHIKSL